MGGDSGKTDGEGAAQPRRAEPKTLHGAKLRRPAPQRENPGQRAGATEAPWMPCRASAAATKPEAFISSTKAVR